MPRAVCKLFQRFTFGSGTFSPIESYLFRRGTRLYLERCFSSTLLCWNRRFRFLIQLLRFCIFAYRFYKMLILSELLEIPRAAKRTLSDVIAVCVKLCRKIPVTVRTFLS